MSTPEPTITLCRACRFWVRTGSTGAGLCTVGAQWVARRADAPVCHHATPYDPAPSQGHA
jgi:hypothetical protein